MFSLFTLRPSPARSPLYAIHVVHNVRELSGKLVKSFRVFLFSISFLMLVYFVSIEGERGDDRGVWILAQKNLLVCPSCVSLFLFWFLVVVFHASCPIFFSPSLSLSLFFLVSVNTLDGHYNSSSVHATKCWADIKVQRYSIFRSAHSASVAVTVLWCYPFVGLLLLFWKHNALSDLVFLLLRSRCDAFSVSYAFY